MTSGTTAPLCPTCGRPLPKQLNAQQVRVREIEAVFERYGVDGADLATG